MGTWTHLINVFVCAHRSTHTLQVLFHLWLWHIWYSSGIVYWDGTKDLTGQWLDEAIDHGKVYLSIANIEQATVNPAQFFEEARQSSLSEGLKKLKRQGEASIFTKTWWKKL